MILTFSLLLLITMFAPMQFAWLAEFHHVYIFIWWVRCKCQIYRCLAWHKAGIDDHIICQEGIHFIMSPSSLRYPNTARENIGQDEMCQCQIVHRWRPTANVIWPKYSNWFIQPIYSLSICVFIFFIYIYIKDGLNMTRLKRIPRESVVFKIFCLVL